MLISKQIAEQGGLVVIAGAAGEGKSTTASAIVMSRVEKFGSFCLTVEDPPEFPLHGDHPAHGGANGKVIQVQVCGASFSEALRDALRCYPSMAPGSMLLVGEVRDGDSAAQMLRAAANGQLVITTLHAADPLIALDRLLALAKTVMGSDEAKSLLSSALRAVIHQRLTSGKLTINSLFAIGRHNTVGATLLNQDPQMLSTELATQQRLIGTGRLALQLLGSAQE
jgi:twitching motility protein PilT